MKSVLYISDSRIGFADAQDALARIVDFSLRWNKAVGITGALVFTEQHFVQFIEGLPIVVDDLLRKLRSDPRHTNITVIETAEAEERQFGQWSLAYSGPDDFIDRRLKTLLQADKREANPTTAHDLRSLMLRMASHNH